MPKTSARLLSLLSLLQARRDWPGALLAERLAVSPRTVRRDVDRLRELGYPIAAVKGPDGGYRLDAGTRLPPLLFDDDQAVALAVALQIAAVSGAGIGEAAARALTTVRQVMPARLRHRVDALRVTAVERPTARPAPPVDSEVLVAVGAAVHAHEVLRFDYGDDGAGPPRRVEPHHLVTWAGRWYLVAWDLDRADWRTFRVDRIRPCDTDRAAVRPAAAARRRCGDVRRRPVPRVDRVGASGPAGRGAPRPAGRGGGALRPRRPRRGARPGPVPAGARLVVVDRRSLPPSAGSTPTRGRRPAGAGGGVHGARAPLHARGRSAGTYLSRQMVFLTGTVALFVRTFRAYRPG